MIENEKKFPSPEMLERIAAALEIDAPALFLAKLYPTSESGTMAEFQELVVSDITKAIAYRIRKINPEMIPGDTGIKKTEN